VGAELPLRTEGKDKERERQTKNIRKLAVVFPNLANTLNKTVKVSSMGFGAV